MKPVVKLKPSKAVSRVSPGRAAASGFVHQLLAVILAFTPVSQGRSEEMKANFTKLVEAVCEKAEPATIQRALTTCWELRKAVSTAGLMADGAGCSFLSYIYQDPY